MKVVLVTDKPVSCYTCQLSHRITPDELIDCRGMVITESRAVFDPVPEHCPLKLLPEEKPVHEPKNLDYENVYAEGFNACLDEIIERGNT